MSDYISREEALDICQKEYEERLRMLDYCGDTVAWNIGGEIKALPAADVVPVPKTGIGDASDGFHTFNELYHHRAILFSVICNLMREKAWKSKRHDTGDMYDGMFIVGIETPDGQATYHYDINPYWDMFDVKEVEYAPKWDGHTPDDAIKRIGSLSAADVAPVVHGEWIEYACSAYGGIDEYGDVKRIPKKKFLHKECGRWNAIREPYCPNCGAKMGR